MDFNLRILGTASAMPVSGKFQSAQALNVHGRFFLIDCGDGTQLQLIKYGVHLFKLDSIFISHIHGDHVFGIFGLLSTLGMQGRRKPLNIFAPSNFSSILDFFLSLYGEGLAYKIQFTPLVSDTIETIYSIDGVEVSAFPLNHRIETFGYMFKEKQPLYNVRKEAIKEYGLDFKEIAALKKGEDVIREGGEAISLDKAAYLPYKPRSYAYVSDTAPFSALPEWLKGIDLLYHETTYLQELQSYAVERFHSTTKDAAECALQAGAGKLLIGHYSSRCRDLSLYEEECRSIFPETYAASEGDFFELPLLRLKENGL